MLQVKAINHSAREIGKICLSAVCRSVPAREIVYNLEMEGEQSIQVDHCTLNELLKGEASVLQFNRANLSEKSGRLAIHNLIYPPGDIPGAVILRYEEIPDDIKTVIAMAGERFSRDFQEYCRRLCLLPGQRMNPSLCVLGLSYYLNSGIILDRLNPEKRAEYEKDASKTMAVNPYERDDLFFSGNDLVKPSVRLSWAGRLSYLLGVMISDNYFENALNEEMNEIEKRPSFDLCEYFALDYQHQVIKACSRTLDIADTDTFEEFKNNRTAIRSKQTSEKLKDADIRLFKKMKQDLKLK